jgi:hypothetical protein
MVAVKIKEEKHVHRDRKDRTSSTTTTMTIVDVAHGVVGFVEKSVEPAKKNTNSSE